MLEIKGTRISYHFGVPTETNDKFSVQETRFLNIDFVQRIKYICFVINTECAVLCKCHIRNVIHTSRECDMSRFNVSSIVT